MKDFKNTMAFCGVDCSACPDYTSGKCPSCRESIGPEGDRCGVVECCIGRSASHCAECERFVCRDIFEFFCENEGHRRAYRRLVGLKYDVKNE